MNVLWKLRRLSRMSAGEIAYRIGNAVRAQCERCGLWRARPSDPAIRSGKPWLVTLPRYFDAAKYAGAADRILAGRFDVFALRDRVMGFPPQWNRDPKTGTVAPLRFGKTLNYRDETLVGDIKYLWEPSRHLQLTTLAQAWHLTRDERYLQGCRVLLDSWFEQCPYPLGVHWTSSLEHAVRLANWSFTWYLVGGEQSAIFADEAGQAFLRRWLECIYRHCHFVAGHLSRYSSANNHLLGEYMGLLIAGATWPCWPESARWFEQGRAGFEREALKQNSPDGVNREQAAWYHHEVADMMLLCGLVARANGREFAPAYWQRLEAMLEFIAALMDVNGNVPMIGDADDAVMVRFDPDRDFNVYRSLLATGAVLFGRGDFKAKAGVFDDKSRWLLGDDAATAFDALAASPRPPRRAFPEGGYYVLGSDFDTPREVRVVADAAPLGYLSIAAHGHADALSFTLSAAGRELLIDPGTYAYHSQRAWRDYFKGTAAHNTVRIDGVDQSVSGGNFMWTRHAQARCEAFRSDEKGDTWRASHDGYRRLRDPVHVSRTLEYQASARRLSVTDRIECRKAHRLEMFWHFGPACRARLQGNQVEVLCGEVRVYVTLPAALRAEIVRGSEAPLLGWYSRAFDEREPIDTLRVHGLIQGPITLETVFSIHLDAADTAGATYSLHRGMSAMA